MMLTFMAVFIERMSGNKEIRVYEMRLGNSGIPNALWESQPEYID